VTGLLYKLNQPPLYITEIPGIIDGLVCGV